MGTYRVNILLDLQSLSSNDSSLVVAELVVVWKLLISFFIRESMCEPESKLQFNYYDYCVPKTGNFTRIA